MYLPSSVQTPPFSLLMKSRGTTWFKITTIQSPASIVDIFHIFWGVSHLGRFCPREILSREISSREISSREISSREILSWGYYGCFSHIWVFCTVEILYQGGFVPGRLFVGIFCLGTLLTREIFGARIFCTLSTKYQFRINPIFVPH